MTRRSRSPLLLFSLLLCTTARLGSEEAASTSHPAGRSAAALPALLQPVADSRLSGDSVLFEWTDSGTTVFEWWLYLGRSLGAHDVYDSGSLGLQSSVLVSNLPHDGGLLFGRLWYRNPGWTWVDFQIDAWNGTNPLGPAFVSPPAGADLASVSAMSWSGHGTAVLEWWLSLGSTLGGYDVWDSGSLGTQTSTAIPQLARDGRTVYARLWFRSNTGWGFRDFRFVRGAPSPPVLRSAVWSVGFPRTSVSGLSVTGTAGQPMTAPSSGGGFDFFAGFWKP